MVMSCSSAWFKSCREGISILPGDGDGGGDGEVLFWSWVIRWELIAVGRIPRCWEVKMDGDGTLLIRMPSWSRPFWVVGVGGCGADLPDSSSFGSPATWAPRRVGG
jgi:hypothetical protein